MLKYAVPAISASLATAAYNITNQILIGQRVGYLGNAAAGVAFPLMTLCGALAYLFGIGAASNFNLKLGAGRKDDAAKIAGTGIFMAALAGVVIAVVTLVFTGRLMTAFGASEQILPYAVTYARIIACGIPFLLFSTACSNLIRADGSPGYSLICTASGAFLNIVLGLVFVFVLDKGIAGAAAATVISQAVTAVLTVVYLRRFKSVKLTAFHIRPGGGGLKSITKLGIPGCLNQIMMMCVQITLNNTLRRYGALSDYGSDIPIAVAGVVSQLNMIVVAFTVGIALGSQPIFGFNYGSGAYNRVIAAYKRALLAVIAVSTVFFAYFQLFPREIAGIFVNRGSGLFIENGELFMRFSERYIRIFLLMIALQGLQPLTATFFTSIGKAFKGLFITVTRQGVFMLPLFVILPKYFGIDGLIYAGPIADAAAIIMAILFAALEFRTMSGTEASRRP